MLPNRELVKSVWSAGAMTALLKGHWTSSINALRKRGRDLVRIIFASFTIGPLLPFIGPSSAAVQLHQTGHSYIV
jgi:hypothetical protein